MSMEMSRNESRNESDNESRDDSPFGSLLFSTHIPNPAPVRPPSQASMSGIHQLIGNISTQSWPWVDLGSTSSNGGDLTSISAAEKAFDGDDEYTLEELTEELHRNFGLSPPNEIAELRSRSNVFLCQGIRGYVRSNLSQNHALESIGQRKSAPGSTSSCSTAGSIPELFSFSQGGNMLLLGGSRQQPPSRRMSTN
eukprot:gene15415-21496_t